LTILLAMIVPPVPPPKMSNVFMPYLQKNSK
jgi:hypothetical protein